MRVLRSIQVLLPSLLLAASPAPAESPAETMPRFVLGLALSDLEPLRDREMRDGELLFAFLSAELERDGWGARTELRAREGRFRDYFPGPVWLEEGYAWVGTPLGELRAGKVPSVVGLADETFGGTLFSLNGVNRNPDWGVQIVGSRPLGWHSLDWAARWAGSNDRVAWEEDGKGVESDPAARLRDGLSGRASFLYNRGLWTVRPGLSGATARIVPTDGRREYRRSDVSGDVTATLGPISLQVQGLLRRADDPAGGEVRPRAERDGRALLFGAGVEFPESTFRYVYSEWRYDGAASNERIHQPAAVWKGRKGIEAIVEYSSRRIRTGETVRTFNAFRLGLVVRFPFGDSTGRGAKG
ncbi:MAG TPA: hypothetical protein PLP50_07300 [Thermoanaerobaculia bacterium]|nr:hypothetical protein [Thermoanaerobaculia bacterium]HQP86137.1 hypothetical protein [Thermoanaerobaculia bacterium]